MGSKQMNCPPCGGIHLCAGIALEEMKLDTPPGYAALEMCRLEHRVEPVIELSLGELERLGRLRLPLPVGI